MARNDDDTVASFPAYAELAQTAGWSASASARIAGDPADRLEDALHASQRYTEGELLGVGGMGKVVLAHDARIGRDVAVKQLHTRRELSAEERARFLREARVQGQLEHPSIVPVYDIEQRPDGTTFFTMRRVIGRTLHAILEELRAGDAAARARYTQRELLTAFATVCLTIDYAHSRGVVHRDLKPANIMLGDFGEVYVLDWGLARLLDDGRRPVSEPSGRLSMTGEMMGTPLYMAPEQMADPAVGPAADVFALGAILFEILTLERLRDAHTLYLPAEARASVRAPQRDVAPELEMICVRATQSDPAERFASARALQEAVVRYLDGDRELAQRRTLAAQHGRAAREALARAEAPGADHERERGVAMRELARAIALDPTNDELVAALGTLLETPPRTLPDDVRAAEQASEQHLVRIGARHSVLASLIWFLFLPFVWVMDFVPGAAWQALLILGPAGLAAAISAYAIRQPRISRTQQAAVIVLTMFGAAATSRLYGPLILLPTLVATFTIVLQAHPSRRMRNLTWALGAAAMIVPTLVEATGLAAPAFHFHDGLITIVPRLHEFPRAGSYALLLLASLAMLVVPCIFISRLRAALNDAQRQLLVRAWHLRRLGDELTAGARPR